MGGNWSRVVCKGWQTPVSEVVHNERGPRDSFISEEDKCTLEALVDFATRFGNRVSPDGTISLDDAATKSFIEAFFTTFGKSTLFTVDKFVHGCLDIVVDAILAKVKCLPIKMYGLLMQSFKTITENIANSASHPVIKKFFKDVFKNKVATDSGSKFVQAVEAAATTTASEGTECAVKESGKAVAKEGGAVVAQASAKTLAKQSAIKAAKVSAAVDGLILGATVGYSGYKYYTGQISREQFRRTTIRRSGAAMGSIGLSAAGTFVGTLIMPGVGTFVGGFIGGLIGDYAGSKVGAEIDDRI